MALFPTTVRVEGLRELNRDFGRISKKLQRELQAEIRKLAEPAADAIRSKASAHRFSPATLSGIRPGSRSGQAIVRQTRRKKTGARPDFGSIQYRLAFLPGAAEAEPEVVKGVEDFLDRITGEGLGGGIL